MSRLKQSSITHGVSSRVQFVNTRQRVYNSSQVVVFHTWTFCFVLTIDCRRHIPLRTYKETRMFVLSSVGTLQNG